MHLQRSLQMKWKVTAQSDAHAQRLLKIRLNVTAHAIIFGIADQLSITAFRGHANIAWLQLSLQPKGYGMASKEVTKLQHQRWQLV